MCGDTGQPALEREQQEHPEADGLALSSALFELSCLLGSICVWDHICGSPTTGGPLVAFANIGLLSNKQEECHLKQEPCQAACVTDSSH